MGFFRWCFFFLLKCWQLHKKVGFNKLRAPPPPPFHGPSLNWGHSGMHVSLDRQIGIPDLHHVSLYLQVASTEGDLCLPKSLWGAPATHSRWCWAQGNSLAEGSYLLRPGIYDHPLYPLKFLSFHRAMATHIPSTCIRVWFMGGNSDILEMWKFNSMFYFCLVWLYRQRIDTNFISVQLRYFLCHRNSLYPNSHYK